MSGEQVPRGAQATKGLASPASRRSAVPVFLAVLGLVVVLTSAAPETAGAQSGAYVRVDTWPSGKPARPADAWPSASGVAVGRDRRVYVADAVTARISVIEPDGSVRFLDPLGADLGLVEPRDLALDETRGRLYAADPGQQAIASFGLDGARLANLGPAPGLAGLGVAPDGSVLAGASGLGQVLRFAADGSALAPWRVLNPGAGRITALDVAADGTVALVVDERLMLLFDKNGRRLDPIVLPEAVIDLVADYSIGIFTRKWYWFTTDRGLLFYDSHRDTWQSSAFVSRLGAMALSGPGGVVVAQPGAAREPSRIHRFTYGMEALAGQPLASWGGPTDIAGLLDGPSVLSAGADGRLHVLDRAPRVQSFAPDGNDPRQFAYPGAIAVDAGPDGTVYLSNGGRVEARAPTGRSDWEIQIGPPGGIAAAGVAYDAAGRQVWVLDGEAESLRRYDLRGAAPRLPVPLPREADRTAVWSDLAVDGAGAVYALDRAGPAIGALAPDGKTRRIALDAGARRLAARADGMLLVLGRDGWVRGYDPNGARRFSFDARRGDLAAGSNPADLAVDAAGDVLVADMGADVVTRYRWDPDAPPPEPPETTARCQSSPDKVAAPGQIDLGQTVEVQLTVRGRCEGALTASLPLDVFLILDRSGSMGGDKIRVARDAARDFVAAADLSVVRIAVIAFNNSAQVLTGLTGDEARLNQAIGALSANGGTRIDEGLSLANRERRRNGRPEVQTVFILLSDGGSDYDSALREANLAKADGVEIYTVGILADAILMRAIASGPSHYFGSDSARDLGLIFERIAERITASALFKTASVVDILPANMALVPGSVSPPALWDAGERKLTWPLAAVPFEGITLRYRLEPQAGGDWPTNEAAWAEFVDGFGRNGRLDFPVPRVRVLAPSPSASPSPPATPTPRASPSATRTPRPSPTATRPAYRGPAYLPLALIETCRPGQRHADVMLVIDSSNSMAGASLEAARAAAGAFIDQLRLPRDQVGLVAFNEQATLRAPLSSDPARPRAALASLAATEPGTRIDRGLARARLELLGTRGRPANTPVIVLLTDGVQNDLPERALREGDAARSAGIQVFTIGLGPGVDSAFLRSLAGDPARHYRAPTPADLAAIYARVAVAIPCPAAGFWAGR